MKLKFSLIAACAAVLMLFSAAKAEDNPDRQSFKITMIAKSSANPVFIAARVGAEAAAAKEAVALKMNIIVDWKTPAVESTEEQALFLEQAIASGTNAILISCTDAKILTPIINKAVERGIPVMCFDNDAPASKRFAYYGIDNVKIGKMLMEELAKEFKGGKGRIAILAGNKESQNIQLRLKGTLEELTHYKNIKRVGTFYCAETPEAASTEVITQMYLHPEIDGWVMLGCWALLSNSLLDVLKPDEVKVVSIDVMPGVLPYIDNGVIPEMLTQPTYDWGYNGVETIVAKCILKKDVPEFQELQLHVISKKNLGEYSRILKSWGYSGISDKYLTME